MAHFEKNCRQFTEYYSKPTTAGDVASASARVANEAIFQCLPLAAKKFVVGNYEFARAIPSMLSHLYNTGVEASGRLKQKLLGCGIDSACRRAIARTMSKYSETNADSSWKITDSQLDFEIANIATPALVETAKGDQLQIAKECGRVYATAVHQLMARNNVWSEIEEQAVYDQMLGSHMNCVSVLKIRSPRESRPEPANQAECFKVKENPIECLSTFDKMAVGSACLGEEFNSFLQKEKIEFCADVVQATIPIPIGGTKTKALAQVAKVETEIRVAATTAPAATTATVRTAAAGASESRTTASEVGGQTATRPEAQIQTQMAPKPVAIPRSAQLESFIDSYKDLVFVQPAENRRFMDLAAQAAKDPSRTRFFDVENSVMKKLNDITGDKNLVTGLTNFQKEVFIKHVEELRAKFPGVKFEVYSDFKSVKIAIQQGGKIDPKLDSEILKNLNEVFEKSNAEFAAKMKELNISVASAGEPRDWFKGGYGQNVDEASLAARRARQESSGGAVNFGGASVQANMQARLTEVEASRVALSASERMQPLLSTARDGMVFPRQDVFDLTRKYSDPEQLAAAIKVRYGLGEFSKADAVQLQTYARGVDEFSPTILIEKRENVNLDAAHLGGASADFLGMGSANVLATAQGIAGKATVAQAIAGARAGEVAVTRTFQARMEAFKNVVGGRVTCSGDDCVRIASQALSAEDKSKMLARLAGNPETRGVRMAFVAEGVPQAARMQLSTHGELIEKTFRKELEGRLPFQKLQGMTFGFDMKTATMNEGTVNLVIGRSSAVRLSRSEEQEMSQAFQRALEKYNQGTHRYTPGSAEVSTSAIRLVPGAGLIGASSSTTPSAD